MHIGKLNIDYISSSMMLADGWHSRRESLGKFHCRHSAAARLWRSTCSFRSCENRLMRSPAGSDFGRQQECRAGCT